MASVIGAGHADHAFIRYRIRDLELDAEIESKLESLMGGRIAQEEVFA